MTETELERKLRLARENAGYGTFKQYSIHDPRLPKPDKDAFDYSSFYPKCMIKELDKEHIFIIQERRMTDDMDEFIAVSLRSGPADCPSLTVEWMKMHGIRYTESGYHYMLQKMNRHMKSLERYGIVRYTGKVVSSNIRAKIWELVLNEE